jgi:hypothetical protein
MFRRPANRLTAIKAKPSTLAHNNPKLLGWTREDDLGSLAMIEPVSKHAQRYRLRAVNSFGPRSAVCKDAGQFRHFRQPAAIILLFDFDT